MNLFEDTNMNGDEFNWAGSLYYGGYLIFLVHMLFSLFDIVIKKTPFSGFD